MKMRCNKAQEYLGLELDGVLPPESTVKPFQIVRITIQSPKHNFAPKIAFWVLHPAGNAFTVP